MCPWGFHEHSTIATELIKLENTHLLAERGPLSALAEFNWKNFIIASQSLRIIEFPSAGKGLYLYYENT